MNPYIEYKTGNKEERLILQAITMRWGKEVRGAPFSTARNNYQKAFPIPESLFSCSTSYGLPYHELFIVQDKKGIEMTNQRTPILDPSQKSWRIGNIEIERTDSEYLLTFNYSSDCGKPVRVDRFHHALVEKAFGLKTNEYGRIAYNGRHISQDTGEWYYELHIINALSTEDQNPNVLMDREPLNSYNQLEILF
ncbi:hypothetical protein [Saccharibacillus qingshengii]|uniref:hypothetical protein n=1 Tax=Saccharibacillus qingshengii TaxID=1763540 RepID=UPI001C12F6AD|nr:hypothetical protein [Saccharibacillus qingshengii]